MFGKTEEKNCAASKDKRKKLSRAIRSRSKRPLSAPTARTKKGKSAQDSIPYERMWPDGICRVSDSHYTKTIQFQDINYQLSQMKIRPRSLSWCDFLNYFDSSIHFPAVFFLNLAASEETFANSHFHPRPRGMPLTVSVRNTPRCCKISWPEATTVSSRPNT